MLDKFRNNLRGTALAITIFIGVIFALSGTGTLFISTPDSEAALIVNGEKISERDVQLALASEKSRILSQNPDFDQAQLDDEQLRPLTLQRIISSKVIAQTSREQRMGVAPQLISELITGVEQFQTDGAFDQDKYRFAIRSQGYASSGKFLDMLEEQFLVEQFSKGIMNSSFVTESELAGLAAITEQQRDFYYTRLPLESFNTQVTVTEQDVLDHYQQTMEQYVTPRQVAVQYIELNGSGLMLSEQVTEESIQARFDQESESAETETELRAAHILLIDPSQALIEEVQAKIDSGTDFETLAAEYSQDFATANSGGDLGYTTGGTFPAAFENALADLQVGEVSAPVTTDAGVHLIKLLEVSESSFTLEEQRDRIAQDLRTEAVEDLLVEKLEMLKELSFNAEDLEQVAQELDLTSQITEPFPVTGGSGIAALPAVVAAAYSPEVLEEGYASEVLELGDDRYVVLKLQDDFPSRQQTLEEVTDQVTAALTESRAQQLLQENSADLLARITSGESVEDIATSLELDWQQVQGGKRSAVDVDPEINAYVFELAAPEAADVVDGFYTRNGDFIAIQLTQVTLGDYSSLQAEDKALLRSVVELTQSGREMVACQTELVSQADIVQ
jgi:peptidyl-prolyl cis-trans isomerase D